ncbi:MAG: carboxymuconolactone decarboxylase family protein [Jatrophihabitantaceae bacterium]
MRSALRRSPDQIRYITPVRSRSATPLHALVYQQAERDFGLIAPPLALHSPATGPMTASWLMLRETLVADGHADRAAKEVVAAAVSLSNACPYCIEVHAAAVQGLAGQASASAISGDRLDSIADEQHRALAGWARAARQRHARNPQPFTAEQAPELIGVAATFHYLNRMVNIFLAESPLPAALPPSARNRAGRLLGWYMSSTAGQPHPPGDSLPLLPAADVPPDLAWAYPAPTIRAAFARASQAIQRAGEQHLPDRVRELVQQTLTGWDGTEPGLDQSWLRELLAELPSSEQAAGRLALLTALASYRVDKATIENFRVSAPSDEALISATSWASLAAARHVASWQLPY